MASGKKDGDAVMLFPELMVETVFTGPNPRRPCVNQSRSTIQSAPEMECTGTLLSRLTSNESWTPLGRSFASAFWAN